MPGQLIRIGQAGRLTFSLFLSLTFSFSAVVSRSEWTSAHRSHLPGSLPNCVAAAVAKGAEHKRKMANVHGPGEIHTVFDPARSPSKRHLSCWERRRAQQCICRGERPRIPVHFILHTHTCSQTGRFSSSSSSKRNSLRVSPASLASMAGC